MKYETHKGRNGAILAMFYISALCVLNTAVFALETTVPAAITQSEGQDIVYACPMHPNETSHTPGSCSICGMFLVAQESHQHDIDDIKTGRSAVTGSGKHHDMNTGGHMNHEGRQPGSKPALFWESQTSERFSGIEHSHSESEPGDRTQPKRMTAEPPGKPTADDQVASDDSAQNSDETAMEHARKHLDPTYVCPMHPQIIQHEPGGNCPICGMNLVAKETATSAHAAAGGKPQVFLEAAVIQNMGVRTAKVDRKILNKQIRTQGLVTADDDRLISIHPRTGGWIEVLHLITEGDRVERKDVLVDFYSPWINDVQLEFIFLVLRLLVWTDLV